MDLDGILLVDKPPGYTSFETVRQIGKTVGSRKAGHAGTLDKSASGLLVVCVNRAASFQNLFMSMEKQYRGRVRFGIRTNTLDGYGKIVQTGPAGCPSADQVEKVLSRYRGKIRQVPPLYSAVHLGGERLYRRALRGDRPEVKSREVEVLSLVVGSRLPGAVEIAARVASGTYIRALARDISRDLGTCGTLESLCRTAVGPFTLDQASPPSEAGPGRLIPLNQALRTFPAVRVDSTCAPMVAHGVPLHKILEPEQTRHIPGSYFLLMHDDRILAVAAAGPPPRYFKVMASRY
jgi:tRNA pseudouridine55 synthase